MANCDFPLLDLSLAQALEVVSSPAKKRRRSSSADDAGIGHDVQRQLDIEDIPEEKEVSEEVEEKGVVRVESSGADKENDVRNVSEPDTDSMRKKSSKKAAPAAAAPSKPAVKTLTEDEKLSLLAAASTSVPKGRPKSGRFWKSERDRFKSVVKSRGLKQSLQQRQKAKEEKLAARKLQQEIKDEKSRRAQELRQRQEENKRRREENARKSEVVQVIRNSAKIKRMKKKQLRQLVKRDTLAMTASK